MGGFAYLLVQLQKAQGHTTVVGNVWITVLFIFRILVLKTTIEDVWNDEESNFLCDTKQPGCEAVCYDKTFPISHTYFWVIQIIFVSTPSLIFLGHKFYLRVEKKKRQKKTANQNNEQEPLCRTEEAQDKTIQENTFLTGKSFYLNVGNIVIKIVFEVGFLVAQYYLYGFGLKPMYTCDRWPCLTTVFCYVSRPTEKTVFIIFMLIVACVSLLLNLIEIIYLIKAKCKQHLCFIKQGEEGHI